MNLPKVTIEMPVTDFKILADWLSDHEGEIASNFMDYGELKNLFITVFGVEPNDY